LLSKNLNNAQKVLQNFGTGVPLGNGLQEGKENHSTFCNYHFYGPFNSRKSSYDGFSEFLSALKFNPTKNFTAVTLNFT